MGAAGCLTVGLANGAFWTLAPLYAQSLGFTTRELALFMSVFIAGGAIVQWPLGRLSDGMDRRWIIATTCAAAAGCGLVLGAFGQSLVSVPALVLFHRVRVRRRRRCRSIRCPWRMRTTACRARNSSRSRRGC